jgi:hypothetical protein
MICNVPVNLTLTVTDAVKKDLLVCLLLKFDKIIAGKIYDRCVKYRVANSFLKCKIISFGMYAITKNVFQVIAKRLCEFQCRSPFHFSKVEILKMY